MPIGLFTSPGALAPFRTRGRSATAAAAVNIIDFLGFSKAQSVSGSCSAFPFTPSRKLGTLTKAGTRTTAGTSAVSRQESSNTKYHSQWNCYRHRHNQRRRSFATSAPRQRAAGPGPRGPTSGNPADNPDFLSILDNPPVLVRAGGRQHGYGLIFLALIPLTAFALGTWQVYRLKWKTALLSRYEDRILRPPLPLPTHIDPTAIPEFDYRRVVATGRFLHHKEMLVGPRLQDGQDGYLVITPFERVDPESGAAVPGSTVLVNRGWIPKSLATQQSRREAFATVEPNGSVPAHVTAFPAGLVSVAGLIRQPWKTNFFTPKNDPGNGKWYFPNVAEMADHAGAQPVWIEEVGRAEDNTLLQQYDRQARGIPLTRVAEVNLRNNHLQYIVTWYALGLATSVMFWLVVKKPPQGEAARRVRRSVEW